MDRESTKRRMTWFGKARPGTVGGFWQRSSESGKEPGASIASAMPGQAESKAKGSQWPSLPQWPPLRDSRRAAVHDESLATPNETQQTEPQLAPPWEQPASNQREHARPPFIPWRFWLASRRQQVGLAAILGIVALTALLSLIVLHAVLPSLAPHTGQGTPSAGRAANGVVSSTAATPTPATSPTATSAGNTPAPSFTVAFTCASGAIGGRGMVCVHTRPNAALSLSVRYCDGNYAKGKGFHGATSADSNGNYTWRWDVSTNCAGVATATVTAKSSGQTVIQSTTFTITR